MGRQYDDSLEFLLDGVAESVKSGCTDLTPSPEMRKLWERWQDNVNMSLRNWATRWKHQALMRSPDSIEKLIASEDHADYDVYATLSGEGVGIWDGRWDGYFSQPGLKNIERHLKRWLAKSHQAIESALWDEAIEQCGGDDGAIVGR